MSGSQPGAPGNPVTLADTEDDFAAHGRIGYGTRTPWLLGGLLVLAVLAIGFVSYLNGRDDADTGIPETAPDFDMALFDGGTFRLEDHRGQVVVLNFWASWCEPCREEAPLLQSAWEGTGADGVLVLGLDTQDARPDARAFVEEFALAYPNVRDPGGDVSRSFGMTGLPETFFISAEGEVVAHARGAVDAAQLEQGMAAAVAGEPAVLR